MSVSQIIFRQIVTMFLYILMGYALYRGGKITKQGSKDLGTILVYLVIPCVIVNSFCVERTAENWAALGFSTLAGAAALLLAILVARVLYPKRPIENFAASFSNAGFMGIPLVQSVLGTEAVFWLVGFVVLLNLLQWTYGVFVMTGERSSVKLKTIVCNPVMVGTGLGLLIFASGFGTQLPGVLTSTIKGVSALNAPLAMMVLGVYLAQADLGVMVRDVRLYVLSAVRLLLIPMLTALVLFLLPIDRNISMSILIGASAPVGANVAIYAQLHNQDYTYACQTVVLSTLLSIASLPAVLFVIERFL